MYSTAPNTYCWRPVDDPLKVPKAPRGEKINLLGAVEVGSGEVKVTEVEGNTTHQEVLDFLEELSQDATEDCPVCVWMDNASIHRHHAILEKRPSWAEKHFFVFYLTPYSPELNDMERVWQQLKYLLLRRRFYKSVTELRRDVFEVLRAYVHTGTAPSVEEILMGFRYALLEVA